MMTFVLIVSCVLNMLLLWYIKELLKRYLLFQEEVDNFINKATEYEGHLDVVYQLESFNGDQTLANLLRHSRDFSKECKTFRQYLTATDETEEETETYEEEV